MIKTTRALASATLLALLTSAAFGQTANTPPAGTTPAFEIANVHASPHTLHPFARSTFHGDRFIMRQANMVDLIAKAYGVDSSFVLGGLSWLEIDHFDIYAKTPPKTSQEDLKLMLRALLADRFHLVVHNDHKPLPAFLLTVGKSAPKMTEADGSADSECKYIEPPPNPPAGTVPLYTFSCHNMTMEAFAQDLHDWAGDYLTNPVVDATGLKGGYDFDFKFHSKGRAARAGAGGITIFDAVDKQLGLKLEAKTAPEPVFVVDSANQHPTPNSPDLDKLLPPPPPPEFEVATIRPSLPDAKMNGRINGIQVSGQALTMDFLITFAYDVTDEMLVNKPKWFDSDHFDVLAKASTDATSGQPGASDIDVDDLRVMMRKFLADRFKLAAHMEDRPLDAYTLVTANPKLTKADPANRTGCKEGPGPDGKDPRIADPILGRLLYCQNMTMAQLADQLPSLAGGYVFTPVLDSTGLKDAYDFTLSFSGAGQLRSTPPPSSTSTDPNAATTASDPSGGLSLSDAMARQLGVKLIKEKRPSPVLVIDHIEEKPTDN